ncbi:hypothetical protein [Roseibium litorale]|uniref:Uncharacterized protein n=1 Tax=Roseibium litorale TaxID=2803841 RepID=A0ABR9CTW1_9HYPH|nr:hypothetical protein [Roseibium litorale]MBD8894277.1 hypothetical protein [Roseibium litorale]
MSSQFFKANDLNCLDSLTPFINTSGHLEAPETQDGYLLYGPYITIIEGFYKISVSIQHKDRSDNIVCEFEVFSQGHIYFSSEINESSVFFIHLPTLKELEFRIKSRGVSFIFQGVDLERISLSSLPENSMRPKIGDYIWQGIHKSTPIEVLEQLKILAQDDISCANSHIQSIPAWDDERIISSSTQLAAAGLSLEAIREISADTYESDANLALECHYDELAKLLRELDRVGTEPIGDPFLDALAKRDGGIQVSLCKEGVAFCRCPFTSIALQSSHGFAVAVDQLKQSYLFYYFQSVEPFYLVVAGFGGKKTFLYFPLTDVVVQLGNPAHDWGNHSLAIETLKRLIVNNFKDVLKYLETSTSSCLLGGSIDNLGHFIWNDLNGLIRFEQSGYLREVNQIVSYRFSFISPETVLDSAINMSVTKVNSSEQLFFFMMNNGLVPVRPTSLMLHSNIADRIVNAAHQVITQKEKDEIEQARTWGDIVWFNLRLHNKSYIEQIDAARLLMERSRLENRNIVLFVDGMRDCQPLLNSIREDAPSTVWVVDGTTKAMHESIAWASSCKTYVATIGSGLTLVTWLAGKPGVAHSEKAHLSQLDFWPLVRSDIPVPIAPSLEEITDIGEGAYCNYSIDPQLICDLVWPLIEGSEMA